MFPYSDPAYPLPRSLAPFRSAARCQNNNTPDTPTSPVQATRLLSLPRPSRLPYGLCHAVVSRPMSRSCTFSLSYPRLLHTTHAPPGRAPRRIRGHFTTCTPTHASHITPCPNYQNRPQSRPRPVSAPRLLPLGGATGSRAYPPSDSRDETLHWSCPSGTLKDPCPPADTAPVRGERSAESSWVPLRCVAIGVLKRTSADTGF